MAGALESGKPSDINFKEIFDFLYSKSAYFVMKNTNKLQAKEFEEIKVNSGSVDEIESRLIKEKIPAVHTKCLFLKDDSSRFYLVAIQANKRLDIKLLKSRFLLKKLFFASPEELKENLNLTPGSVSIFGMINAKNVRVVDSKEETYCPTCDRTRV